MQIQPLNTADNGHDFEYLEKLTVLYVEDDAETRSQFSLFLGRFAGTLLVAENGLQGVQLYREHRPSIVLTDIMMPDMDGLAMAREIKQIEPSARIIIMTAFEQSAYLLDAIDLGIDKYVVKPVDSTKLLNVLLVCAHRMRADESLQRAAYTDPLTGLLNRRELMRRFDASRSLAERHGTTFSFIMIDIDHFKKINDLFGHIAGDWVLKGIAATLTSSLRNEDICGRWGGEEFLVILPETGVAAAAITAEKLRNAVSELVTKWEGKAVRVTISLGVAGFTAGCAMDDCLKPADDAMYRAKIAGRNRVEIAQETEDE